MAVQRVGIIDTHTGGEPTRVVISGGPELGTADLATRRQLFGEQFDEFRSAVVNEPRGSDVMVGALLVPPTNPDCAAGVLFFNNVGNLWMCGHGTIGVAEALCHLGRIGVGTHRIETAVGIVGFEYHADRRVTIRNVPSYRFRADVAVEVPGVGRVTGDIAWGGNWFFLVNRPGEIITVSRAEPLTQLTCAIRQALVDHGITGADGAEIDHIELFSEPCDPRNHSRNFVLCPGKAYDRSPCGTGTSAKLACLFAAGKLKPGEVWRQESIVGSVFEGSVTVEGDRVIPRITGQAYVNAESTLILDPRDPFQMGIRP